MHRLLELHIMRKGGTDTILKTWTTVSPTYEYVLDTTYFENSNLNDHENDYFMWATLRNTLGEKCPQAGSPIPPENSKQFRIYNSGIVELTKPTDGDYYVALKPFKAQAKAVSEFDGKKVYVERMDFYVREESGQYGTQPYLTDITPDEFDCFDVQITMATEGIYYIKAVATYSTSSGGVKKVAESPEHKVLIGAGDLTISFSKIPKPSVVEVEPYLPNKYRTIPEEETKCTVTVFGGSTFANADIQMQVVPVEGSGGHDDPSRSSTTYQHNPSNRPHGSLSYKDAAGNVVKEDSTTGILAGKFDENGTFVCTYKSGIIAGEEKIAVTSGSTRKEAILKVKMPGLVTTTSGDYYETHGDPGDHVNPYSMLSGFKAAVLRVAKKYYDKYQVKVLINDCSLEWGGKFDMYGNWGSPHQTHNAGYTCDWNTIPGVGTQARKDLLQWFSDEGLGLLREFNKSDNEFCWHLTWLRKRGIEPWILHY